MSFASTTPSVTTPSRISARSATSPSIWQMRKSRTKSSQCAVDVIDEKQCQGVVWQTTAHSMLHFRDPSASSVFAHGSVLWSKILRFVVTPEAMTTLCAISRTAARASWTPATWEGTRVNTNRLKPRGSLAMRHPHINGNRGLGH